MLRDPDHVVDSIRRRGNVSVEKGKYRWARAIRSIYQIQEEYPDRSALVRFVDLVTTPEAVMEDVCSLLQLPFSPRMVEGYRHTPQYDRDSLDPSVATRDVASYEVDAFDPEAFEMYSALVEQAARRSESRGATIGQ
jgi:hypothetical protein